ncbi:MAG TPA: TrbI/VirB10 family protein [Sphingomonas sp.]|nr:TrbI/VirB10 family protein [Sphingomonas sp.]
MRQNMRRHESLTTANDTDPREGRGAEVIDLATRKVLPSVAQKKSRSDGLGLVAGVGVVLGLGLVTLWSMDNARKIGTAVPARPAVTPNVAPRPLEVPPNVPSQAVTTVAQPAPAPLPIPVAPPQGQPGAAPAGNPLANPTVVFDASALPAPALAPGALAPGAAGSPNDEFANRIGGVGGSTAIAAAGIDPKTTVTQGTLIAAVLETAINTDVPGYVRAVVSADVRSFDGSRVLVPRSSRLIGQYKSGMQAGQKRAYVIWTRLIRPDGVSVNLGSPAVGFAGETGLAGKVNNHFFERFGSAMLLSVIGGLSALGNAGTAVVVGGQTQSAAAAAIGQTGQIGPTVVVHQGEPVRVFTARDLDFSKVTTE